MPTTTTETSNPLWDLQAQYLPSTFDAANELYNLGAPQYYTGQTVAGQDPTKVQGLNLGVDAALGAQTDLTNAQSGLLTGILGGTDAGTQQLANQAAQATGGTFGSAGSFGSGRHAQAANQAAANAILDRQLAASGQVQGAQAAALAPGQTLSNIGNTQQQYNQQLIDADKAKFDYEQQTPYNWLTQYQNQLGFPGVAAPSTTSTSQQATTWEKILGGAGLLFGGGGLF